MAVRGIVLAFGAAAAVHTGALVLLPGTPVGSGAGDDGAATFSVAMAGGDLAKLVEAWEAMPEVSTVSAAMASPKESMVPDIAAASDDVTDRAVPAALAEVEAQVAPKAVQSDVLKAPWVPEVESAPKLATTLAETPGRTESVPLSAPKAVKAPEMDTAPPALPDFALAASPRPDARPDRRVASMPAVQTQAAGDGGGATQGRAAMAATGASAKQQAAAEAVWAAAIQARIARAQVYPRGARGDGRVRLAMTITSAGALAGVRVTQSSGVGAFDTAAVRAAKRAAPFPAAPKALTEDRFAFGQWVTFQR